ncbi:craniofacial development protein 1 [Toxorhynchites rutilus septentrionalis]|uniref:craniofacial development protein 1 n=1 Tax=Toxorhynchites rutilus septentrionalis TaxID=329112 RepID=UPI00247A13FB|nr:craniofacial development protein 1 [Toxorhynchites rutilus septentrionalis]XP_055625533.1 craniofacial development protein 1 [Toxorhynchites rutilus septentrionalis]
MDSRDYSSESDESDEDFCPDKANNGSASEVETDDNTEDENGDDVESGKSNKRKRKIENTTKKKTKVEPEQIGKEDDSSNDPEELDEEEEKRRTDALWADFLSGPGSSNGTTNFVSKEANSKTQSKAHVAPMQKTKTKKPEKTPTVTKIFEFAGEAVEVIAKDDPSIVNSSKPGLAAVSSNANNGPRKPMLGRSSAGGLGSVLSQIGKKNKLSTLEKTKLDWNSFKRNEGIDEELKTHNKGKEGFLERKDFLQRADLRQFEIEKAMRQTKRSNR